MIFTESTTAGKKNHLCHPGSHSQVGRRRNSGGEGEMKWRRALNSPPSRACLPFFGFAWHRFDSPSLSLAFQSSLCQWFSLSLSLSLSLSHLVFISLSHSWVLRCFSGRRAFRILLDSVLWIVLCSQEGYSFESFRFFLCAEVNCCKTFLVSNVLIFDRINRVKKKELELKLENKRISLLSGL